MCDHPPIPIVTPDDVDVPECARPILTFRQWARKHGVPTPYLHFADPPSPRDVAVAIRSGEADDAIIRMLRNPRRPRRS